MIRNGPLQPQQAFVHVDRGVPRFPDKSQHQVVGETGVAGLGLA